MKRKISEPSSIQVVFLDQFAKIFREKGLVKTTTTYETFQQKEINKVSILQILLQDNACESEDFIEKIPLNSQCIEVA